MSTEKPYEEMTADERLLFNQSLRHDIVVNLTTNSDGEKSLPEDSKVIESVRGLLKDNDSSIYTARRLNVDETAAENDKKAAELLEAMMFKAPTKRPDGPPPEDTSGPEVDASKLKQFDLTEGEVGELGGTVDIDKIMAKGRSKFKGVEEVDED